MFLSRVICTDGACQSRSCYILIVPQKNKVAQAMRELRSALGFNSQQAFAQHLGIAIRTVAHYENDRPPRGAALIPFQQLAIKVDRPELANVFWEAVFQELGQSARNTVIASRRVRKAIDSLQNVVSADHALIPQLSPIIAHLNVALNRLHEINPPEGLSK